MSAENAQIEVDPARMRLLLTTWRCLPSTSLSWEQWRTISSSVSRKAAGPV
jgi:hypothetical protein